MAVPRFVMRASAVLVVVLGLALTLAASLASAYESARATARTGLLVGVLLAVFLLGSWLVNGLAAKLWKTTSRRFSLFASTALTLLFALALSLTVLRPTHYPHLVPVARANTQYWNLPTGSRIAYSVYEPPPGVPARVEPIVFLHGGPGFLANDFDHRFYSQFAKDGFKVYLFDQVGSGLSDRLPRATDYTVERFVADLEEIRHQIGAERMILIGHSWGGMLAAYYAAAHPDRVARLVFHSPGAIWNSTFVPFEYERTEATDPNAHLPPPRIFAAFALSYVNMTASEHLVSQVEFGDWELAGLDPRDLVCKGELDRLPHDFTPATMAGINPYPLLVTNRELKQKKMDVRPKLGSLRVPAIALEGQCDMIPWSDHSQYKRSIPGLQEFYFADAAHYIYLSQPEKFAAVIRSFLLDQPPPFPAYQGEKDPRPPIVKIAAP